MLEWFSINHFDIEFDDFVIDSRGVTDSEEKDLTGHATKSILII